MAITSGFFNSVNGDRRYKADFFAEYFASFIANGVFPNPSTGMQVIANGNMTVSIRAGKAWIKGYYVNNDADYLLSLVVADGVLKRIDRIVLRLDFSSRQITPVVKKGTAASSPTAPSLQRDADAYELGLADVLITNGAISISQANITDTRLNTALCGIVHGVVDQVDTTTIFNQYMTWFNEFSLTKQSEFNAWKSVQEADYTTWTTEKINEFNSWFTSIQDILSGDVAGKLLSKITQIESDLAAHKADEVKHITAAERTKWNNPATTADKISVADTANLFTATDVEGALKELFTNASDGKIRIANAAGVPSTSSDTFTKIAGDITTGKAKIAAAVRGKGGTVVDTASFDTMAAAVGGIVLGKKRASGNTVVNSGSKLTTIGLDFTPSLIMVYIPDVAISGIYPGNLFSVVTSLKSFRDYDSLLVFGAYGYSGTDRRQRGGGALDTSNANLSNGGFTFSSPLSLYYSSSTFYWYAFE